MREWLHSGFGQSVMTRLPSVLALLVLFAQSPPSGTFTLSGHVRNASGQHTIYVLLWQVNGLTETHREIRIEAGREPHYEFHVPAGKWAISAYEDRNENERLDMGMFGPKEPSGFWPAFRGRHKPRFDEVATTIDGDVPDADIVLR